MVNSVLVKEKVPFLVLLENFLCQHLHFSCLLFMYGKADLVCVRVIQREPQTGSACWLSVFNGCCAWPASPIRQEHRFWHALC